MSEIDLHVFELAVDVLLRRRNPHGLSYNEVEDLFLYVDGTSPSMRTIDGDDILEAAAGIVSDSFKHGLNGFGQPIDRLMEHLVRSGVVRLR